MPRVMKWIAAVSLLLTPVMLALYARFEMGPFLSMGITCGTIAYHFIMRLLVGWCYDRCMGNRADVQHPWFRQRSFEPKLYDLLQVQAWKNRMPTYEPALFDPALHTWDEIAQAMCQSELVHETIVLLSFLPVAASIWLGDLPVFLITSVLAACFDLSFVLIQRYNRPTVLRLAQRQKRRAGAAR